MFCIVGNGKLQKNETQQYKLRNKIRNKMRNQITNETTDKHNILQQNRIKNKKNRLNI